MKSLLGVVRSLTLNGRALLAVGVAGLFAGALLGWVELGVLGVGSLAALAVSSLWVVRGHGLHVQRTLHPPRVTVGESAIGVVEVRNPTKNRVAPQMAEDVLGDQVIRLHIPALAGGEVFSQPYTVPARARGLFQVGPVRLSRVDPLGFFHRVSAQGSVEELWVRPRTHRLTPIPSGWAKDLDGPTSDAAPPGSAAFHALREYQHGDDLRHVHWRTSARRGQLMVRHFVDTRRSQDLVVLDPRSEFYRDGSFEEAVEVAASVCAASQRAGRLPLLALPGQLTAPATATADPLDRLALVQPVAEFALESVFTPGDARRVRATACIAVCGAADATEVAQAARRWQRSGLVVVVRCVPGARPGVAVHGNALVIDIASAASLPALWLQGMRRS